MFILEKLNQNNHIEEVVEKDEDNTELVGILALMLNNFMKKLEESSDFINRSLEAYQALSKNIESHLNVIIDHLKREESSIEEVVENVK